MKRIISLVLLFSMVLSLLCVPANAANTPEDALGKVDIFSGGFPMEYLAVNGKVQTQEYTYFNYRDKVTGETKEIPAYCCNPNQYGVPQTVAAGESIEYLAEEAASDPKVVGLVANMYPHRGLDELKLENLHQAFYAGKIALWCYLIPEWDISKVTVNPTLTGAEKERGERILAATIDIYNRGMAWTSVPKPRLDTIADRATAYPVTVDGKQYKQQIFTVTSDTWVCDYEVNIKFQNPDNVPAGTRITDLSNKDISTLIVSPNGGSYNGKFKVLYPAESVEGQSGSVQFSLSAKVYQYAVFYALCQETDKYGNLQNYLCDTDPQTNLLRTAISSFDAPDDEDTDDPETGLEILKLEEGTETPLSGAAFEVKDPEGKTIGTYTTGYDGKITIPLITIGNYTVTEVTPPQYHLLPAHPTQSVTVKYGEIAKVSYHNASYGDLRIEKIDADTGDTLNGARVQIKHIESGAVYTGITGLGGSYTFTQLKPGAYEIQELSAPNGWQMDSQTYTTTVVSGQCVTFTLKNTALPGLKIVKYDRESHMTLPGVSFKVYRDATLLGTYETDALGEITLVNQQPGTYRVEEVDTGDTGHIKDPTPQEVELKAGDGIKTLYFFNDRKPGIHIIKVDSADPSKVIPNAVFEIKAVDGSYGPREFRSNERGEIDLSALNPGAYVVTEISCPGYIVDSAQRIIELRPNQDEQFVFTNSIRPSLQLIKTSADGSRLAGVTFRIARIADGSRYLDRTTNAQGEIFIGDLEPGVYSVKESATKPDHILDTKEYHVELFPGRTSTIVLNNDKRPNLLVYKYDADTGAPVPGTVFQVKAADGHSVDEIKTGTDGSATLKNLLPGVYEISEKSVPSPYLLDAPSQLVTLYPNRDHTVYFENHKKPSLTIVKEDSVTHGRIANVKFQVWWASNKTDTGELRDLGTHFTDKNGEITLSGIEDGWLKITELEPAPGYAIKEPATQECYIKGGESKTVTFQNTPLSALVVWKYDSVTGVAVKNAVFQVKYLSGTSGTGGTVIGTYKTSANGSFTVTGLAAGTYVVEELASDSGHVIDAAPQTAYISGAEQDVIQLYFGNSPKGGLLIKKIDSVTHKPLSDVEFMVTTSDGTVVGNANGKYVTDSAGSILIESIAPGTTLVVKETRAKDGYLMDDVPQTAKINAGETVTLEFRNQPTSALLIVKKDAVTGQPLSDVEFLVTDSEGGVIGSANGKFVTDAAGTICVSGLTPGMTVIAKETRAKDGYLLDDVPQTAKIKANETVTLEFRNQPTSALLIVKKDAVTGEPLSGVEFLVTDSEGGVIGSANGKFVTDATGTIRVSGLTPGMTVIAKETRAKDGYLMDDTPQTAKIKANETVTLEFRNQPTSALLIVKKDAVTGQPLSDVEFLVTDSEGGVIGSANGKFVTDAAGTIRVSGLTPGMTVIAKETRARDGYLMDDTPQTAKIKVNETVTLEFRNQPTSALLIVKKDAVTGEPLSGVEFLVTDSEGGVIGSANGKFITDAAGTIRISGLTPGMTVIAKETRAKDGYLLDDVPQTAKIKANETITLEFRNQPKGNLIVLKKDSVTGAALQGVTFKITYADGSFLPDEGGKLSSNGLYTTDANGKIALSGVAGTLVVTETQTIPGYTIDEATRTQTVVVNPGDTQTLTFTNTPTTTLVIQKYIEGSKNSPIPGVEFLVTDSSGAVVGPNNGKYTTDANGRIAISGLTPGSTVTAKETKTAEGFVLDGSPQSIQIKAGEVQTLTFWNKRAGGLELIKVNEDDKTQRIPNSTFEIRKMDGALVDTVTTGKNGRVYVPLDAGDYYAVETEAAEGFKLDDTPQYFTIKDNEATTLTVTNKAFSGILIHKIDSVTRKGIYGVTFLLYDGNMNPVEQFTTDQRGYAYIDTLELSGKVYLRELDNDGYIPDEQLKTVYVRPGETTEITWENTPITGQIQIIKKSADYNPTTGLPAGALLEGAVFEITDKAGNLVDTIRSDSRGLAVSKQLPLSRYTIREVKAPDHYGVSDTELTAYLEHEGQILRFEVTNKSMTTGVSITKTGPKEITAGQPVRYVFSGIANTSNVRLDNFYWRDTIPAEVRLDMVITGTYNFPGTYKITYRVNGGEPQTLADNLSTSKSYTLAASATALGLASNQRVTEVMFVFGQAPAGFAQVEKPYLYCTALASLNVTSFVNVADAGGSANGKWVQAVSRWVTTVYGKPTPLPRTGY